MTGIFNMDDLSDQVTKLNYKLVDDCDSNKTDVINNDQSDESNLTKGLRGFPINNNTDHNSAIVDDDDSPEKDDSTGHDSTGDDNVNEIVDFPRKHKSHRRRGSLNVDLNIDEPFVALSLQETNYKPSLDDFEPIMVLGTGSYGKVLLVKQLSSGKLFAQKQLKKVSLLMNDEVNLTRTLNEKKILERVYHPNIVKLYYAFQDFNKVYLILEYLDGGELFYHLAQEQYLPETKASFYIAQLILALRYLHLNLNVIYRDLKPENCMLDSEGNLVLTDFGLSKVNDSEDLSNSFIGTVQYMAPEILKGESYSYEVDWWSLGCISFDLLTGNPPFTGNNNKKIMDKILASKKNLKFPFYLSLDAKDFLRKLLTVNVDKRYNLDDDNTFNKIKQHRFFRNVNWKDLESNSSNVLPPILPIITNPILAENFDKEFTEMNFTPPLNKVNNDILYVKDFTFTNDKFLNNYEKFRS